MCYKVTPKESDQASACDALGMRLSPPCSNKSNRNGRRPTSEPWGTPPCKKKKVPLDQNNNIVFFELCYSRSSVSISPYPCNPPLFMSSFTTSMSFSLSLPPNTPSLSSLPLYLANRSIVSTGILSANCRQSLLTLGPMVGPQASILLVPIPSLDKWRRLHWKGHLE